MKYLVILLGLFATLAAVPLAAQTNKTPAKTGAPAKTAPKTSANTAKPKTTEPATKPTTASPKTAPAKPKTTTAAPKTTASQPKPKTTEPAAQKTTAAKKEAPKPKPEESEDEEDYDEDEAEAEPVKPAPKPVPAPKPAPKPAPAAKTTPKPAPKPAETAREAEDSAGVEEPIIESEKPAQQTPKPKPQNNSPLGDRDSFDLVNQRVEKLNLGQKPQTQAPEPTVDFGQAAPLQHQPPKELPVHTPETPNLKMERVLPVPTEKWEKVYNNYIKLGFGRFLTPVFQANINGGRNTKLDWGAEFRHLSAFAPQTDYANFMDNALRLKATYLMKNHRVFGAVQFQNYNYNTYGDSSAIKLEETARKDSISQRFTRFEAIVGFAQDQSSRKELTYELPLRFQVYSDKCGNSEFHAAFMPKFHHQMSPKISLDAEGLVQYSAIGRPETATDGGSRIFGDVKPTVQFRTKRFMARGGFRLNAFSGGGTSLFGIYPVVEAEVALVPKYITLDAAFTGQMQNNTRFQMITENPYINPNAQLVPTKEKYRITAGLGGFIGQFNYRAQFMYRIVENMPVYFSPLADGQYYGQFAQQGLFNVAYESGFKETAISIQAAYDVQKRFRLGVKTDVNLYSMSDLPAAFHLPGFRTELFASYKFLKKITVLAQFNLIGSRPMGLNQAGEVVKSNIFPDLNLNATYQISKRFGAFVEFNNLLNQKYQRWNYYLERPLDLKLGATFSF